MGLDGWGNIKNKIINNNNSSFKRWLYFLEMGRVVELILKIK